MHTLIHTYRLANPSTCVTIHLLVVLKSEMVYGHLYQKLLHLHIHTPAPMNPHILMYLPLYINK